MCSYPKKNKFMKVIALLLVVTFSFQQLGFAEDLRRDLRDEDNISAIDVIITVVTAYFAGSGINQSWSLGEMLLRVYGIPLAAGAIVDKLGVENKYLAAGLKAGLAVGMNAGLDALGEAASSSGNQNTGGEGGEGGKSDATQTGGEAANAASQGSSGLSGVGSAAKTAGQSFLSSLWSGIKSIFSAGGLKKLFNSIVDSIWGMIKNLGNAVAELGKGVGNAVVELGKGIWNAGKSLINGVASGNIMGGIWSAAVDLGKGIWGAVTSLGSGIKGLITNLAGGAGKDDSKFWTAFWRKGIQGALYGAAKAWIADALERSGVSKGWSNLISYFSALGVSEGWDLFMGKLTGTVFTVKGDKLVPEEESGDELTAAIDKQLGQFLNRVAISLPAAVGEAILVNNGKAGEGMLLSTVLQAVSRYLVGPHAELTKEEKEKDFKTLQTEREERAKNRLQGDDKKEFEKLIEGRDSGSIRSEEEAKEADAKYNKLYAKSKQGLTAEEKDKEEVLLILENRQRLAILLGQTQDNTKSALYRGQLAEQDFELMQATRSFGGQMLDALILGGISFGLRELTKSSKYANSEAQGTLLNFYITGFVKAGLIFFGNPLFEHPDSEKVVNSSDNQTSDKKVKLVDKSIGAFFGVLDNVILDSLGKATTDAASVGLYKPVNDLSSGKITGVSLTSPYDSFFIARYDDVVQNIDYTKLSNVVSLIGMQMLGSLHNQSVENLQQSLYDIGHKAGVFSASPLEKAYVFLFRSRSPFFNYPRVAEENSKKLEEAYARLAKAYAKAYKKLHPSGTDKEGKDEFDKLIDDNFAATEKDGLANLGGLVGDLAVIDKEKGPSNLGQSLWVTYKEYMNSLFNDYDADITAACEGERDKLLTKVATEGKDSLSPEEYELLLALDDYINTRVEQRKGYDQPAHYGRMMILRASYDLSQMNSGRVDQETIAEAARSLNKNLMRAAEAKKTAKDFDEYWTSETKKPVPQEVVKGAEEYYFGKSLKGIDVYEDLSGNRWVIGIGEPPQKKEAEPAPIKYTINLEVGVGLGYAAPPEETVNQLINTLNNKIKEIGLDRMVSVNITARTDSRGPQEVNEKLLALRKAKLEEMAQQIAKETGLSPSQIVTQGQAQTAPVPGADPQGYADQRKGSIVLNGEASSNTGAGVQEITIGAYPESWCLDFTPKKGETVSGLAKRLGEDYYEGADVGLDLVKQISRYFQATGQTNDANKIVAGKTYSVPIENNDNFVFRVEDNGNTNALGREQTPVNQPQPQNNEQSKGETRMGPEVPFSIEGTFVDPSGSPPAPEQKSSSGQNNIEANQMIQFFETEEPALWQQKQKLTENSEQGANSEDEFTKKAKQLLSGASSQETFTLREILYSYYGKEKADEYIRNSAGIDPTKLDEKFVVNTKGKMLEDEHRKENTYGYAIYDGGETDENGNRLAKIVTNLPLLLKEKNESVDPLSFTKAIISHEIQHIVFQDKVFKDTSSDYSPAVVKGAKESLAELAKSENFYPDKKPSNENTAAVNELMIKEAKEISSSRAYFKGIVPDNMSDEEFKQFVINYKAEIIHQIISDDDTYKEVFKDSSEGSFNKVKQEIDKLMDYLIKPTETNTRVVDGMRNYGKKPTDRKEFDAMVKEWTEAYNAGEGKKYGSAEGLIKGLSYLDKAINAAEKQKDEKWYHQAVQVKQNILDYMYESTRLFSDDLTMPAPGNQGRPQLPVQNTYVLPRT